MPISLLAPLLSFARPAFLAFLFFLPACTTVTGPNIASEEEERARNMLLAEARAWQRSREERVQSIAQRITRAAGIGERLQFHFVARADQTRGRIHPDSVNAWTDGSGVWITRGMVRFVRSDDELALVLAHEIAHAARGHMNYLRAKQALGLALGIPAAIFGGQAASQLALLLVEAATKKFDRDQEREADLFGITWAHRAGFDMTQAKEIFRRMAIEIPESMEGGFLSSHPPTSERLLAMERIVALLHEGRDPIQVFASGPAPTEAER